MDIFKLKYEEAELLGVYGCQRLREIREGSKKTKQKGNRVHSYIKGREVKNTQQQHCFQAIPYDLQVVSKWVSTWSKPGGKFRPEPLRLHPSAHGACPVANLHPFVTRPWPLATETACTCPWDTGGMRRGRETIQAVQLLPLSSRIRDHTDTDRCSTLKLYLNSSCLYD